MDEQADEQAQDDARMALLLRGRLTHYKAIRWWHRRLVEDPRASTRRSPAARIIEQSEAGIHARSESEPVRRWMMATVRDAVADEETGAEIGIDGQAFDPGEHLWLANLEEHGNGGADGSPA